MCQFVINVDMTFCQILDEIKIEIQSLFLGKSNIHLMIKSKLYRAKNKEIKTQGK
jgi:hypothetical protein